MKGLRQSALLMSASLALLLGHRFRGRGYATDLMRQAEKEYAVA